MVGFSAVPFCLCTGRAPDGRSACGRRAGAAGGASGTVSARGVSLKVFQPGGGPSTACKSAPLATARTIELELPLADALQRYRKQADPLFFSFPQQM
eukprot:scaffold141084_cov25-Prasinocladus_malaysianus.AAC.2